MEPYIPMPKRLETIEQDIKDIKDILIRVIAKLELETPNE